MYKIDDIYSCEKCEEFKRKCVAIIIALIEQNLGTARHDRESGEYNSQYCSSNASAMELMIDLGLTNNHNICGKWVTFDFNREAIEHHSLDFPDYDSELI